MRYRIVRLILLACLASSAFAADEEPKVKPATDKELEHELKMFERDFGTEDIDFKLDALKRLSKCVHQKVTDQLIGVLYKDPDPHVKAAAASGLKHQVPYAKTIGRKTTPLLDDKDTDPKVLRELILTLGALEYTKAWESMAELIAHDDDGVVVAVFNVFGAWKELRGHREILNFWEMYPEDGRWATGTVNVDTGAAGTADARAAKAKWMAKYGNKAKQRPRPDCVQALRVAVLLITGEELKKPVEFRDWVKDHKREIKAAERRRD